MSAESAITRGFRRLRRVSDATRRDMAELVRRYLDRADTDDHRADSWRNSGGGDQ